MICPRCCSQALERDHIGNGVDVFVCTACRIAWPYDDRPPAPRERKDLE